MGNNKQTLQSICSFTNYQFLIYNYKNQELGEAYSKSTISKHRLSLVLYEEYVNSLIERNFDNYPIFPFHGKQLFGFIKLLGCKYKLTSKCYCHFIKAVKF